MKRITHYCLFVLCTLVFPFTGFSQENARVTLNMKDVSLLEVFDEITKQTQYEFVYSKPLIDKAGKVSVNVKNETLEKTLETILEKVHPLQQHPLLFDYDATFPDFFHTLLR